MPFLYLILKVLTNIARCVSIDWTLRKRKPMKRKYAIRTIEDMKKDIEIDVQIKNSFVESAEYGPWDIFLIDKKAMLMQIKKNDDNKVFPTLRGLLEWSVQNRWIEVDFGAIPFLMNGADCMVAGIQSADAEIIEGDLVWIRDETHKKPLAIGWAILDGPEMVTQSNGKGVETVHWIGDSLWEIES